MKIDKKRHIASMVLLAVFVPMLLLSSLHFHVSPSDYHASCVECVHHNCSGHLGQLSATDHPCVLCHFLTLTFVAAAIRAAVSLQPYTTILYAPRCQTIRLLTGGIISLRAPPAV